MRAATFALTVFRDEEETILTFLDVLKHDPLYNWYSFSLETAHTCSQDGYPFEVVESATGDARRDLESSHEATRKFTRSRSRSRY